MKNIFRNRKNIILFGIGILLLIIFVTIYQLERVQQSESNAAESSAISFVDDSGNPITETFSPTVNVVIASPWGANVAVLSWRSHKYMRNRHLSEEEAGASIYTIYNDSLQNGWTNGSYRVRVNYHNADIVYSGERAIRVYAKSDSGLEFNAPDNFSTKPYTAIQFFIHAIKSIDNLSLYAENRNFSLLKSPVKLSKYGGNPSTTGWTQYTVPLKDLNADNKIIGDITIHNGTNRSFPVFYVDQVQLLSNEISVSPTKVVPTFTQTPTPVVYTQSIVLAEDRKFTKNVKTITSVTMNPYKTSYTFSNTTNGRKRLYVKIVASNGESKIFSQTLRFVNASTSISPTAEPISPTVVPSRALPTITSGISPTKMIGGSMSGLHVSGGKILNGANQVVQLHGVNRSSFEYMCTDNSSDGQNFEGPADQSEITAMKSWNINSVRLVLNEDCWLGLHGLPYSGVTKYREDVKRYVDLLTTNNISVIINLHFNGDGNTKAREQEPMADRAHSNDFWRSLADTFKNNSSVLFELYNEPHDISWNCWLNGGCTVKGSNSGDGSFVVAGMQEMLNTIRLTGATNIIITTGLDWGSDVTQWLSYRPKDILTSPQIAVGWHTYNDGLTCQTISCWNTTLVSIFSTAPIIATEIGQFDCKHDHIDRVTGFLDQYMGGYYAWSWGSYNCAQDPALITNWQGSPTQTFGQGYKNHLLTRP